MVVPTWEYIDEEIDGFAEEAEGDHRVFLANLDAAGGGTETAGNGHSGIVPII